MNCPSVCNELAIKLMMVADGPGTLYPVRLNDQTSDRGSGVSDDVSSCSLLAGDMISSSGLKTSLIEKILVGMSRRID